jgi:hypothetical protein
MWAEEWDTQEIELNGRPVELISYRISNSYLAEVESTGTKQTIARAIAKTREKAREEAVETAAWRIIRSQPMDLSLTVGG